MNTSFPRVVVALLALVFVLAACASETGSQWTFAPTTASEGEEAAPSEPLEPAEPEAPAEPAEPEAPEASAEPEAPAEPEESEAPDEPEAPAEPEATAEPETPTVAGEARVIDLQADSALRFTDAEGQPVPDIEVTPGETITFRVDNTSGFPHNFWIGTDAELSVMAGDTDVGIPDWSTGVEEVEWVVPADLSDLKFACTVPGHYYTMQGTFSLAEGGAPAEPAEPETPAEPEAPAEPVESVEAETPAESEAPAEPEQSVEPPAEGSPRVIELEADAAIRFMQDGEQIIAIDVTPGETVLFRVDNTAGFPHNFYIGADDDLKVMGGDTDTGLPDWDIGVQELEWVVPDDISAIRFACTVPGHYYTMNGDFTISP